MLAFAGMGIAQPNIVIMAPQANSSSQLRAPNGLSSTALQNACYLVRASELTALTGTNITGIGFSLIDGTGTVPVTGNFTVYLENTNDITYNKGTNFVTAIATMSTSYVGTITMPVGATASTLMLTLTTPFVYTGGGLYVAFSHNSSGPFDPSNPSTIDANNSLTNGGGTGAASAAPSPTLLTLSNFRPSFLFQAVNTATNETSVSRLIAPGKVAKSLNTAHDILVDVKNSSIGTLNNIAVALSVTGANPFTATQTVNSLAGGAVSTVTFSGFNPQNIGQNNISVTLLPDQNPNNNTAVWTQSVTCSTFANNPPLGTYTAGIGLTNPNTLVNKIKAPANGTLTGLRLAVANATANPGNQIYGVIFDATGNPIAYTNTITIGSTMLGTFVNFDFPAGQALTAGTDYYIGMGQPASGYFPLGAYSGTASTITEYFIIPQGGGTPAPVNAGVFGFEAVFTSTNPVLSVTPSRSVICKGESVTLTASGASTYVWNNNNTNAAIVVSPTTTTGYTVTGTDANGCVNSTTYTQTVALCTGLTANANDGQEISIFPNPASGGKTTLSGLTGVNTVSLYNTLGQLISSQVVSAESCELNLENQAAGSYIVKITNSLNQTKTLKFLNQ